MQTTHLEARRIFTAAIEALPVPREGSAKQVAWAVTLRAEEIALLERSFSDALVELDGGVLGSGTEINPNPASVARALAKGDARRDGRKRPEAAEVFAIQERGAEWMALELAQRIAAALASMTTQAVSAKWWISGRSEGTRVHFLSML